MVVLNLDSTSAADRYNSQVPYLSALQPESSPKFSHQTHMTLISIGRARRCKIEFGRGRAKLKVDAK